MRRGVPARAFRSVFDLGKPVVAAVNGHAIAGGCVLVAACDHRIMAAGTIGVPELRVGVPSPSTSLEIMEFALGPVGARKAIIDGANHEPREARALGLVDAVSTPDALLDDAKAAAARLAADIPPDTFRHTKAQLRREIHARLDGADERATVELWTAAATDGRIRAFMDRTMG